MACLGRQAATESAEVEGFEIRVIQIRVPLGFMRLHSLVRKPNDMPLNRLRKKADQKGKVAGLG